MEREEILNKARNENGGYDEREKGINTKSSAIAKTFGIALGFIIAFVELFFLVKSPLASMAVFSVCFFMDAIESWYRFAHLRGRMNLIKSIVYSVLAMVFFACLIHFFCME